MPMISDNNVHVIASFFPIFSVLLSGFITDALD